mmetsp:Transcript_914/g.2555  ORF Transcript_914/g.2555 Transcript_914/m.2555 type:complete len:251 (-) Transcript_914:451-1203(-)
MSKVIHNLTDLFVEAKVKHPVRLVQTNIATDVQGDGLLLEEVPKAAGRCHNAVTSLLPDRFQLFPGGFATNHQLSPEGWILPRAAHGVAETLEYVICLTHQLSARRKDDADGTFPADKGHANFLLEGGHYQRQSKRKTLSRSGEGDPDHIPTGQNDGESLHLNRRRTFDVTAGQIVQNRLGELHIVKRSDGRGDIVSLGQYVPLVPNLFPALLSLGQYLPRTCPTGGQRLAIRHTLGQLRCRLQSVCLHL